MIERRGASEKNALATGDARKRDHSNSIKIDDDDASSSTLGYIIQ